MTLLVSFQKRVISIAYRTGLGIDSSDETQIGVELFVKFRVFRVGRIIIALC